jgi:hypothetical protein
MVLLNGPPLSNFVDRGLGEWEWLGPGSTHCGRLTGPTLFGAWEILGYGFQDMVFRTWDLNFGTWMWDLNFGTWISHRGFTVAFGHGHPLVILYIITTVVSVHPSDDGSTF